MKHLLIIAFGGSLGAVSRYLISKNIQSIFNQVLPLGTLFVNVIGSFLIGFLFYLFDYVIVPGEIKSFLTIGFLGAFTTFSTFSLETINLFKAGEIKLGITNILTNNILCLVMVILGILASRLLLKAIR